MVLLSVSLSGIFHEPVNAQTARTQEPLPPIVKVPQEARLAKAYYNDGIRWLNAGRIDRAEIRFRESLSYDSLYIPSIERLANILKQQGKADSLSAAFKMRADMDSLNPVYTYITAVLGDTAEAEQMFNWVIKLDSTFFWGHFGLGRYKLNRNDYAGAIENLRTAVAVNPAYPDGQLTLGIAYEKSGDTTKALRQYQKTLCITPKAEPEAYLRIGFIYAERADTTLCMDYLQKYLDIVKEGAGFERARAQVNSIQAAIDRAKLLEEQRKKEEALKKKKGGKG